MLVSFLICGLEFRPWEKIRDKIACQIYDSGYDCEVLCNVDSGENSSGKKRNELTADASGEYIAFVDDDDDVSDDYVKSICDAVSNSRPDVVSFAMEVSTKRSISIRFGNKLRKQKRVSREVWRLGLWPDNRRAGRMAANHLCCWKKEIAEKSRWCEKLGYGDDQLWYGPLNAMKLASTCEVIRKNLYRYDFSPSSSMNQTSSRRAYSKEYFGSGLRCFLQNSVLLVEDGFQSDLLINCYSPSGKLVKIDTLTISPFHTVRLV